MKEKNKVFTIFAGVNGSGKSTLYNSIINRKEDLGVRLNTDEYVKESGCDWRDGESQLKAGIYIARLRKDCLTQGKSFNQETTLTGQSIMQTIKKAKDNGYTINMYYIGLDSVDIAKERVADRVKNGGHGVSEADIERRYNSSFKNLEQIYTYCDKIKFFDNTAELHEIAEYSQGKLEVNKSFKLCKWVQNLSFTQKVKQSKSPALQSMQAGARKVQKDMQRGQSSQKAKTNNNGNYMG